MKKLFISIILLFLTKSFMNKSEYDILINKEHGLNKNYMPNDLVYINLLCSNKNKQLRKKAAKSFEKMCMDASKLGYRIVAVSAYRSYYYQDELYKSYLKEKDPSSFSAKAGYSEHQTGLAVDIEGSNYDYNKFLYSKEYKWVKNNSYKYGFIIRYPKGKKELTGYKFEPWHLRYVGKIAKYLYKNNLTLEEYKKTH